MKILFTREKLCHSVFPGIPLWVDFLKWCYFCIYIYADMNMYYIYLHMPTADVKNKCVCVCDCVLYFAFKCYLLG